MLDPENIKKIVGAVTAVFAAITGGYTMWDKVFPRKKPILEWAPEHFSIGSAPASGDFRVIVARRKLRDDCSVEKFTLEVRDAALLVHTALPSIPKFSGPAGKEVEKFAYTIKIKNPQTVAVGRATLLAHIIYKCPEGAVTVNYPNHKNLTFLVEADNARK